MAERSVICGGLPVPTSAKQNAIELDIGGPEDSPNRVKVNLGALSARLVEHLPLVIADLVDIATYIYCADQFTSRGGTSMRCMGRDWVRHFKFVIPVRQIDLWSRVDVRNLLGETLDTLSGDRFDFEFAPHPDPVPKGLQPYLDFGASINSGFLPEEVILFSGGLDSFAGAVDSVIGRGRPVALVSHQASTMIASKQNHLVQALRERTSPGQLFHVPVNINKGSKDAAGFTQRSRSFLFAVLGLAVARAFRKNTVQFYENGVVSVNLPIAGHVLRSRATRTTHPKVLSDFSRLFSLLLEESITIENPFFWKTKADVIEVISQRGCADLISDTFSCTRVREATQRSQHCGVCTQCIDRRFGILGAKLGAYELPDQYLVDLFRGTRKPGLDVVTAESYLLHSLKLATMTQQAFLSTFGQIFRILSHLPGTFEENATKLHNLHRRHGQIVQDVVSREIVDESTLSKSLTLPATCLLSLVQSASIQLPEIVDPTELKPSASQQAARDKRPIIERPLVFALDEKRKRFLLRGDIEIKGKGFDLLKLLVDEFEADLLTDRAPQHFRFTKTETVSKRLGTTPQVLRQRVMRVRKHIETRLLEVFDFQAATDEVIENDNWHGYRLNPYLHRLTATQIGNTGQASAMSRPSDKMSPIAS